MLVSDIKSIFHTKGLVKQISMLREMLQNYWQIKLFQFLDLAESIMDETLWIFRAVLNATIMLCGPH